MNLNKANLRIGVLMFFNKMCTAGLFCSICAATASELPLTQYVNPLIGTDPNPYTHFGYAWDTGNVFPGAVVPRGMLAWSPDTTHANKIAGGYWYPDQMIEGFSLTHFSGRGVPCLKDFPFMPTLMSVMGSPGTNWTQFAAAFSHTNESASSGCYRVRMDNGIEIELTATPRTGFARFDYPAHSTATLLIRADGSVSIHDNEVSGFHDAKIGGGRRPYSIYFVAEFDRPFQHVGTWLGEKFCNEAVATGKSCGAVLTFDTATNLIVQVRVGISYVSIANARANLDAENPTWDFAFVQQKATSAWNKILNRIQVEGGTFAAKQIFYTALYHCFIHPNLLDDANGDYPGMDGKIHSVESGRHQYQNIPGWDQYRSLAPLAAILTPKVSSDIMQSLVNYAQQDAGVRANGGGLPRWEQVNRNSGGMVGDGDDIIIASAHAFGARNFDVKGALAAMVKGASQPGTTSDGAEVREGLQDYLTLGYVPGAVSATLEYCTADFALAQFAEALGDREKHSGYLGRAQNWTNLFDTTTGLMLPRNADGSRAKDLQQGLVTDMKQGFVEASPEQTVWMLNFNLPDLINRMGGAKNVTVRLDKFFTRLNSGMRADTAYMGNEPGEGIPWIYDFAGSPARTQEVVRRIQTELFTDQPGGLPGNDDAGAISSWYVFSALGLYPEIPGVAGFVTGSPVFPKAAIRLEDGKTIQIVGKNASRENRLVQGVKLNGQDWQGPWIPWSAIEKGGNIIFDLGSQTSSWGQHANQIPQAFDTASR